MVDNPQDALNAIELAALAAHASARVARVEIGSRVVWVKRAAAKALHPGHYLQWIASIGLPGTIFRPSPPERGDFASRGEAARMRAFGQRGFAVPEILFQGNGVLILADCGKTLEARLQELRRGGEAADHDRLLVKMAESMGRAHAAGLVHGRPHPRDMFLRDGEIGYMDFEQNAVGAMRLERAQARDALYVFGFVCDLAMLPQTPMDAYEAWRDAAPEAARGELSRALGMMRPVMAVGRAVAHIKLGADLRRFLAGTGFLQDAVRGKGGNAAT